MHDAAAAIPQPPSSPPHTFQPKKKKKSKTFSGDFFFKLVLVFFPSVLRYFPRYPPFLLLIHAGSFASSFSSGVAFVSVIQSILLQVHNICHCCCYWLYGCIICGCRQKIPKGTPFKKTTCNISTPKRKHCCPGQGRLNAEAPGSQSTVTPFWL